MKYSLLSIFFAIFFLPSVSQGIELSSPIWSSKNLNNEFWGISVGDIDGDGSNEILLLERDGVVVAELKEGFLKLGDRYNWPKILQGNRIFSMNIDGGLGDEILVSAFKNGIPASFALKFIDGKIEGVFEGAPWHMRVMEGVSEERVLTGQRSNSGSFFAGRVAGLALEDDKLKVDSRLSLPRGTNLYDFTYLSLPASSEALVALQRGYSRLTLLKGEKKNWKEVWSSPVKFGGSLNVVETNAREPLSVSNETPLAVGKEPVLFKKGEKLFLLDVQYEMPLKNVIGRIPHIRSSKITGYKLNEDYDLEKVFETEEIAGYVADYIVTDLNWFFDAKFAAGDETKGIIVLVQPDTGIFSADKQSRMLIFGI